MSTIAFITNNLPNNLLRFLSNCPIKEKKNRWTEWRIGFPMDLGSLETIRSYLETISRLRNHQSSGVKVHSTGNLHLPRVGAKPRGRREGEPARKSLRRRVRERGTQDTGTFRWRKNTHRDEFRPAGPVHHCRSRRKRRGAGDGQVLALVSWLLQGCTGPVLDAQRQLHLSIRRHREQPAVPLSFDRESGNPAGYLPRMDLPGVRGRFGFLLFTEAVKATRRVYTWTGNSIFARMWARCRVIVVESVTCWSVRVSGASRGDSIATRSNAQGSCSALRRWFYRGYLC